MNIIFFTDPHATCQTPINRTDKDYEDVILKKIDYIFDYAEKKKSDAVICGGDLFHTPNPAYSLTNKVIQLLGKYTTPFYMCVGNHDIFSYQTETIYRTALGTLFNVGYAHYQDELDIDGYKIRFLHYSHDIEKKLKEWNEPCDILINHATITDGKFFGEYSEYKDLNLPCRFVCCSHYHPTFGIKEGKNGTKFISPGSLTRNSAEKHNRERIPSFVEFIDDDVKIIELPATHYRLGDEVFNAAVEAITDVSDIPNDYIERLKDLKIENTGDIKRLIEEIASNLHVSPEVIKEALNRVGY